MVTSGKKEKKSGRLSSNKKTVKEIYLGKKGVKPRSIYDLTKDLCGSIEAEPDLSLSKKQKITLGLNDNSDIET